MDWLKSCLGFNFLALTLLFSTGSSLHAGEITFKKDKIEIGGHRIEVELAESPDQHAQGLMFRKSLGQDKGMLFVFDGEEIRSFWMKNTFIDLSIGYFDKDKKLIDVQEMKAAGSVMDSRPTTYPSKAPAKYALEMSPGWFGKRKIKIGQRFRFVSSSKL